MKLDKMLLHGVEGRRAVRIITAALLCSLPAGCGVWFDGLEDTGLRPTAGLLGLPSGQTLYATGENRDFENAIPLETFGRLTNVRGRIDGDGNVDVYRFGPLEPGDRVYVEMIPATSLYGAVALFDANGAALLVNDHRNVYLGRLEPFVDIVMQDYEEAVYLAVSHTPGHPSAGDYTLLAAVERNQPVRPARPDVVLLDFGGARGVRIGSRAPIDVPEFDAARISTRFAGRSDELMNRVVARVRRDFAPFNVEIRSTHEGARADASVSRIYFGAHDPGLLGVAEGIDEFNGTGGQSAVVFVDTFAAFEPVQPDLDRMASALANVASHEIGHLLGLVHTQDPGGIMDVTASLNDMLMDQAFRFSPLHADVFPIGGQDAILSLAWSVGLRPGVVYQRLPYAEALPANSDDDATLMRRSHARGSHTFSSCCLNEHH